MLKKINAKIKKLVKKNWIYYEFIIMNNYREGLVIYFLELYVMTIIRKMAYLLPGEDNWIIS